MHPVCPACKPWGTVTQQNLGYTYPPHRSWHLLNKVTPPAWPGAHSRETPAHTTVMQSLFLAYSILLKHACHINFLNLDLLWCWCIQLPVENRVTWFNKCVYIRWSLQPSHNKTRVLLWSPCISEHFTYIVSFCWNLCCLSPSSFLPTLPQTTSSLLSPFLWTLYALTSQQAHLTPPALLPSDSTTSWAAKWCKSKHPEDLLASQSLLSSFSVSLSAGKSESFQSKNHPSFFTTNNNLFSIICTLLDPLFLPMFW